MPATTIQVGFELDRFLRNPTSLADANDLSRTGIVFGWLQDIFWSRNSGAAFCLNRDACIELASEPAEGRGALPTLNHQFNFYGNIEALFVPCSKRNQPAHSLDHGQVIYSHRRRSRCPISCASPPRAPHFLLSLPPFSLALAPYGITSSSIAWSLTDNQVSLPRLDTQTRGSCISPPSSRPRSSPHRTTRPNKIPRRRARSSCMTWSPSPSP